MSDLRASDTPASATPAWIIRRATPDDIPILSGHRAAMFADMGRIHDEQTQRDLIIATTDYFSRAIRSEEYLAWVAVNSTHPDQILGGAGVQRRSALPFPLRGEGATGIGKGVQAIVLNVYTDPAWRRRGIARALMSEILAWSKSIPLDTLVLHASNDGRPLYESLGFVSTNEMVIVP